MKFLKASLFLALVLQLNGFCCFSQESGITFQTNLSWQEILKKAKAENKYVFVDCYATWCVPCKWMEKNIFSQPAVGRFFNEKFINVKMQMDESSKDSESVKRSYDDAKRIKEVYSVLVVPTYLFFAPNGKIVHKITSAIKDTNDFISRAATAFDTTNRYYSVIEQYKQHTKDSASLRRFIEIARNNNDLITEGKIGEFYIKTLKDPFSKDNLILIKEFTTNSKQSGFDLVFKNPKKINSVLGRYSAENFIDYIVTKEEVNSFFEKITLPSPNWEILNKKLKKMYPHRADKLVSAAKVNYYLQKRMSTEFENSMIDYMDKYKTELSVDEINSNAWSIFLLGKRNEVFQKAASWIKFSFDNPKIFGPVSDESYCWSVDTYANLLYRVGDINEAITWERKALQRAKDIGNEREKKSISDVLQKMEKGEKTWKDL